MGLKAVLVGLLAFGGLSASATQIRCRFDSGYLKGSMAIYEVTGDGRITLKLEDDRVRLADTDCEFRAGHVVRCPMENHNRRILGDLVLQPGANQFIQRNSMETENGVFLLPESKLACELDAEAVSLISAVRR